MIRARGLGALFCLECVTDAASNRRITRRKVPVTLQPIGQMPGDLKRGEGHSPRMAFKPNQRKHDLNMVSPSSRLEVHRRCCEISPCQQIGEHDVAQNEHTD
jgi:hypothetical protein